MSNENSHIKWFAPEFRHYPKNTGWYITFGIVAALVVIFFIVIQKDYFAAVTTALLAGLSLYFAGQTPDMVEVAVTPKGVHFGNLHYPYKQLKHFWIVHTPHHKTVNFVTTTYVNNHLIIELEEQDPESIREFLLNYLPEHEDTEPTMTQRVMHRIKF